MMPINSNIQRQTTLSLINTVIDTQPLITEWECWAKDRAVTSVVERQRRSEALLRLRDCIECNHKKLDLSYLNLTTVPEKFPSSLQVLRLEHNQLLQLPNNLPDSLNYLNVSNNRLTTLPEKLPTELRGLNVNHNPLHCLPNNLPSTLHGLFALNAQLKTLPENLPNLLQILVAENNELTHLPQSLPETLILLNIKNNPIHTVPIHLPHQLKFIVADGCWYADAEHLSASLDSLYDNAFITPSAADNHNLTPIASNKNNTISYGINPLPTNQQNSTQKPNPAVTPLSSLPVSTIMNTPENYTLATSASNLLGKPTTSATFGFGTPVTKPSLFGESTSNTGLTASSGFGTGSSGKPTTSATFGFGTPVNRPCLFGESTSSIKLTTSSGFGTGLFGKPAASTAFGFVRPTSTSNTRPTASAGTAASRQPQPMFSSSSDNNTEISYEERRLFDTNGVASSSANNNIFDKR